MKTNSRPTASSLLTLLWYILVIAGILLILCNPDDDSPRWAELFFQTKITGFFLLFAARILRTRNHMQDS